MRQSERRRKINKANRTRVRSSIKKLRGALVTGNSSEINTLLPSTVSIIDKAVQKGVLHKNAAARHKSRLTHHANTAGSK